MTPILNTCVLHIYLISAALNLLLCLLKKILMVIRTRVLHNYA